MIFSAVNDTIKSLEKSLLAEWKRQTWALNKSEAYLCVYNFEVDLADGNIYIISGNYGVKDKEDNRFQLVIPQYANEDFIIGMFSQFLYERDGDKLR